jgi:hypothetical protein
VKEKYHRQITLEALSPEMGGAALEIILAANIGQDALRYQFGHDHFHYDNNSFKAADAYVAELRQAVVQALERADASLARQALGRLTHTVQDFYAHSNYISLWRARFPLAAQHEVEPEDPELLQEPRLRSGRLYYPLEIFSFVGALRPLVLPLLPRDSHAWMNLDAPEQPGFEFAFAAAVKRTRVEYFRIKEKLTASQIALLDGSNPE